MHTNLPLVHRVSSAATAAGAHAHAPHMVAAKDDGHEDGEQQTERGPMAVGHMAARKVGDGRQAVQDAAAVPFDARVQHVLPVVPRDRRGHAAHEATGDDQRIEDGQQLLLVVGGFLGHDEAMVLWCDLGGVSRQC